MRKTLFVSMAALVCLLVAGVGVALAQTGDPKRGAELYAANCAVCHGADAQGRIGAKLSKDFSSINEVAFLQETISKGIEGSRMPAWGEANGGPLSDQDIADIAAYVTGLLGGSEPIAPAPTAAVIAITPAAGITGDPSAGAVIFAQNCVACHGARGEGRIGAKLVKSWPALNPSAYVRTTVENGVEGTLMPAWLDENGGPLTKADIDNVSAFIVSISAGQGSVVTATPTAATGPLSAAAGWIILAVILVLIGVVVVVYYRRA